jgi:hypothetical protein
MSNTISNEVNVRKYVNDLTAAGYNIEASVEGLLGVVKNHGEIIFTTAGVSSLGVIEAFLGGLVYAEVRNVRKNKRG